MDVVDLAVETALAQQLVVPAALDDAAALQHQDLVGRLHGAQPLGDDEGRAALHELRQRLLDQVLRLRVHARGGVVEDEDARVQEQRARDGHALLLAAGEGDAALADPGVVAVREGHDEVVDVGDLGSVHVLLEWRSTP